MSKRGHYLGGHTLVPREWLTKANPTLEKKHERWEQEGRDAVERAEAKRRLRREESLRKLNEGEKRPPKPSK
jgi:hypothetical protein